MLNVTCGKCGRLNRVGDDAAGQKVTCAQCGATVRVPASAAPVPAAVVKPWTPVEVPVVLDDAPRPPEPHAEPPARDDLVALEASGLPTWRDPARTAVGKPGSIRRPAARRRRFGRLNRITLLLTIGGGIMAFAGGKQLALSATASNVPQDLTCQQLAQHGFGPNANVRLGDYRALSHYVYKAKEDGTWGTLWVPLVSVELVRDHLDTDGQPQWADVERSGDIHVLFQTDRVKSEADLKPVLGQGTVQGMVVNRIASLSQAERDKLREDYPAADLDHCWILEDGRTPNALRATGTGLSLGGLALAVAGLWFMFKA